MPNKTCLHDMHQKLGARIVDFHGWLLPVQYEGILAEHNHTRSQVSLFDTCHMGQLLITGPDAADRLGEVLVQDCAAMEVGQCKYGFLLNEQGGILDDTIVARLGEEEFFLVVNAGPAEQDHRWVRTHLPESIDVQPLTSFGKLDVQGPRSAEVLAPHTDADLNELGYFRARRAKVGGVECIFSRTGYTGELGYEIFYPAAELGGLFQTLLGQEGVKPAGLGARDSLRLEMGYPLYGEDIDQNTNPLEAELGFFVTRTHDFIGAEALERARDAGVSRRLVAFQADTRRRANHGNTILCDGRVAGEVTSGAFSPSLQTSIGIGYVSADVSAAGRSIVIDTGRAKMEATLVEKPLYTSGTCRKKVKL